MGLDFGDEGNLKNLQDLKAEFKQLTSLLKENLGDEVEKLAWDDNAANKMWFFRKLRVPVCG